MSKSSDAYENRQILNLMHHGEYLFTFLDRFHEKQECEHAYLPKAYSFCPLLSFYPANHQTDYNFVLPAYTTQIVSSDTTQ